ncbi:hypothetical protein IFM89_018517 [Coptis chinensis]|uniref:Uncharacterized protein n=1 Tax=Coptis chinensis TaxID=261450 RepID=A0A835HTQ8_9MAGN|nr:hypothetical protein IFM89_018517 [Coptis chinensis]
MSMGCKSCDNTKPMYRKGLWSPEEDEKLRNFIFRYGHGCWSTLPSRAGLQRNGKSCRLRWINYLRPGLKRGIFTTQEDEIILALHRSLGNKWSQIAQQLPGRTDNEIKNYWHSYLKKKVVKAEGMQAHSNIVNSPKTTEPTSMTSKEPNDELSSFESFQHEINTSASMLSSFPKILFSEWLSTNHVEHPKSHSINSNMVHMENSPSNLSVVNECKRDYSQADEPFLDDLHHELLTNGATFARFGLVDYVPMGEMFGDLNMYHDFIYQ